MDEIPWILSAIIVENTCTLGFLPQLELHMTTIAYLRVSKDSQDVKNQRLAILEFARGKKFEVDEFMEVSVSSRRVARLALRASAQVRMTFRR